jgi:hypothetical protein
MGVGQQQSFAPKDTRGAARIAAGGLTCLPLRFPRPDDMAPFSRV